LSIKPFRKIKISTQVDGPLEIANNAKSYKKTMILLIRIKKIVSDFKMKYYIIDNY